jgi:hypothetical protein
MSNIKPAKAKQAKEVYLYKHIRTKLHKTKAVTWYNKMRKQLQLSPNYIRINTNYFLFYNIYWKRCVCNFYILTSSDASDDPAGSKHVGKRCNSFISVIM